MPASGGWGPNGISVEDISAWKVIEALRLLEERKGAPVTAAEMKEMADVFVGHQKSLLPSFTPRLDATLRLFAERVGRNPTSLPDQFNDELRDHNLLADAMPRNLGGQLKEGFEGLAQYFERAATILPARFAEATMEQALQARRAVATISAGCMSEDQLKALQRIFVMIRTLNSEISRKGDKILSAIPLNEKGLLEFPLFMRLFVEIPLTSAETLKWRSRLQSVIRGTVRAPSLDLHVDRFYAMTARAQIAELTRAITVENQGDATIPAIYSLHALLDRDDEGLARGFIRLLIKLERTPLLNDLRALLYVAASVKERSFGRARLTESVLHLTETASVVSGVKLMQNILPLAITYLTGSDTHDAVDNNLSLLMDKFLAPTFSRSEQEDDDVEHMATPYDMRSARDFDTTRASDLDSLLYHFLLNLVHKSKISNSTAAKLLEVAARRDLNGARIWLMNKALYQDMLIGTKDFDQAKFDKYLAPLLDDDPKVQQLIDCARFARSGPNEEFFRAYENIVRARNGHGPAGALPDASSGSGTPSAPAPETQAEGRGAATSIITGYTVSPEASSASFAATQVPQWTTSIPGTWAGNFGLNTAQSGAGIVFGASAVEAESTFALATSL